MNPLSVVIELIVTAKDFIIIFAANPQYPFSCKCGVCRSMCMPVGNSDRTSRANSCIRTIRRSLTRGAQGVPYCVVLLGTNHTGVFKILLNRN
jgi:hypothetical protein